MRNQLGVLLEKLRKDKKLTLRDVKEKTGLSHSYIRSLELNYNPKTKSTINPTPETLRKLAAAYDYSYEELMRLAGFISSDEDPIKKLSNNEFVSEKRKMLANLILNDLSDEEIESWLKILNR